MEFVKTASPTMQAFLVEQNTDHFPRKSDPNCLIAS